MAWSSSKILPVKKVLPLLVIPRTTEWRLLNCSIKLGLNPIKLSSYSHRLEGSAQGINLRMVLAGNTMKAKMPPTIVYESAVSNVLGGS